MSRNEIENFDSATSKAVANVADVFRQEALSSAGSFDFAGQVKSAGDKVQANFGSLTLTDGARLLTNDSGYAPGDAPGRGGISLDGLLSRGAEVLKTGMDTIGGVVSDRAELNRKLNVLKDYLPESAKSTVDATQKLLEHMDHFKGVSFTPHMDGTVTLDVECANKTSINVGDDKTLEMGDHVKFTLDPKNGKIRDIEGVNASVPGRFWGRNEAAVKEMSVGQDSATGKLGLKVSGRAYGTDHDVFVPVN